MRAGDDAIGDLAGVQWKPQMRASVLEAGDDRALSRQQHLLAAKLHRPHAALRNVEQSRGEEPAALGVEREWTDEADATFAGTPSPFTCWISVISGQASCTAFFTPA